MIAGICGFRSFSSVSAFLASNSRIAAYSAGLDFVGYEIDKTYFDLQETRFAQHAAQMDMFLDGCRGEAQISFDEL